MLIEQTRKGMGTLLGVHVVAEPEREQAAQLAVDACFAWWDEVERRLTRFDDASELCQLNAAGGGWRAVSATLHTAVEQSIRAASASDGLFDPTLLDRTAALGYDRDFKTIAPDESSVGASVGAAPRQRTTRHPTAGLSRRGAWRNIQLDPARRRLNLPPGVRLDLGGIAKGWAADVALECFFAQFPDVIVDLGGDMRVRGETPEGEPWPIGIGDPRTVAGRAEPEQTVITLRRGAVATSGAGERWWRRDGQRQHHLLDPRTGQAARLWITDDRGAADDPATLIAWASALAPTAAHAEVAAKVALLRGYPQALRTVEAAWSAWQAHADAESEPAPYGDEGVALVVALGSGEVVCSSNLQQYVDTLGGGGDIWLA